MRWATVAPLWILGALLMLPSPVQAQPADSQLPVSIDRIRAALQRQPPVLRIPAPSDAVPTFRVEVHGRPFVLRPPAEEPFDPTYGLPSAGELLMRGIGRIGSAVADYRHARAERRAQKEVDDALAAFCAAHACGTAKTGK